MNVEDIYSKLDKPFILINGKGSKVIVVLLRDDVHAAIESYLRYRPTIDSNRPSVIVAKKPYQPMSPNTIWKLMETLGKKIGIGADVHSMRRAALSYTALEGLNEKGEAGSCLNYPISCCHEQASTTFKYIKDAAQARCRPSQSFGKDERERKEVPNAVHADDTSGVCGFNHIAVCCEEC